MSNRTNLLTQLLQCDRPVHGLTEDLAAFGWDSDKELVVLTPDHVRSILHRFAVGKLPVGEVQAWAEAVEGRDDIGLQEGSAARLKSILFELANPELTECLNVSRAQKLLSDLST